MLDDMLADSWLFKELIEKGKQQGLEEGQKEGLQKALDLSRQTIVALVEGLYPSLVSQTKTKVEGISDPGELQQIILQISLVRNEEDVRAILEK